MNDTELICCFLNGYCVTTMVLSPQVCLQAADFLGQQKRQSRLDVDVFGHLARQFLRVFRLFHVRIRMCCQRKTGEYSTSTMIVIHWFPHWIFRSVYFPPQTRSEDHRSPADTTAFLPQLSSVQGDHSELLCVRVFAFCAAHLREMDSGEWIIQSTTLYNNGRWVSLYGCTVQYI